MNYLFVSKPRFDQIKNKNPIFGKLVETFESKKCLKAISTIFDLSEVKINQYKFLFKGLNLGKAIKLMLEESFYLPKSVLKKENSEKEVTRIVSNWVKMLVYIHKIPKEIKKDFTLKVMESVKISLRKRFNLVQ